MPPADKTTTETLVELTVRMQSLATIVDKLNETIEGTNRTPGMKEKITIAQYNIEANKQGFLGLQDEIARVEERLEKSIKSSMLALGTKLDDKFAELKKENEAIAQDNKTQGTLLERVKPWLNVLQWLITLIAATVVTMLITGRLHLGFTP